MTLIKTEGGSITENTPAQCIKRSFSIGSTKYTNICANNPEFSIEKVSWGSIEWSIFILLILLLFMVFKKLSKSYL